MSTIKTFLHASGGSMPHAQYLALLLTLLFVLGSNNKPSQPVTDSSTTETSATPASEPAAATPEAPAMIPEVTTPTATPTPAPEEIKLAKPLAETTTAIDLQAAIEAGKKEPQGEIQISGIVSGFTPCILNESGQPQAMLLLEGGRLCIMNSFFDIRHTASSALSDELGIPCFFDDAKSIHGVAIGDTVVLKGELKPQTVNDLLANIRLNNKEHLPTQTFHSCQLSKTQLVDHQKGKLAAPPSLTFDDVTSSGKGTDKRQELLDEANKKGTFKEGDDLIRLDIRTDYMVESRSGNLSSQMKSLLHKIPLVSSLEMASDFNDDMAKAVASLPYCEKLSLSPDQKHSASTVETLLKTPGLHSLKIDKPEGLAAGDFKILEAVPGLRNFRLDGGFSRMYQEEGNEALAHLCKTPDLRSLEIYKIDVKDDGLSCLKSMPELHSLVLNGCPLTGSWIKSLASPQSLWKLDVDGRTLNDDFANNLASLTGLQKLRIYNADMTSKAFVDSLSKLTRMQLLVIYEVNVDNEVSTAIQNLKDLQYLSLIHNKSLKPDFALAVQDLPVLYQIDLGWTPVGDQTLISLARSTSLRSIDLSNTSVTDQGVRDFVASYQCKHLAQINLGFTKVTPAGLSELAKIPSLEVITVQKNYELPEKVSKKMKEINPGLEVIPTIMIEAY